MSLSRCDSIPSIEDLVGIPLVHIRDLLLLGIKPTVRETSCLISMIRHLELDAHMPGGHLSVPID